MRTKDDIIGGHYVCTCDEIYKSRGLYDPACTYHTEGGEIELIMDEYAKEVAIDFFKWNALKVDEYINYLTSVNKADGVTDKQNEANHFEGSTIEGRFILYQQEKSSLK